MNDTNTLMNNKNKRGGEQNEKDSDNEPTSDVESNKANSEDESVVEGSGESDAEGSDVSDIDEEDDLSRLAPSSRDNNRKQQTGGADGDIGDTDIQLGEDEENSENETDDEDENYLQKFNQQMRDDLILNFHPESKVHNYEEIKQLAKVTKNKNGIIIDELHKTIPLLTKYEKTRILGQRSKQIECGAIPLIQVPPNIIDSYLIAKLELEQGKIPFIVRRPLPNGGMEYWYVSDLENV